MNDEEKVIKEIVDILMPSEEAAPQPTRGQAKYEDLRDGLKWRLKELVNIAAAKGRGQVQ